MSSEDKKVYRNKINGKLCEIEWDIFDEKTNEKLSKIFYLKNDMTREDYFETEKRENLELFYTDEQILKQVWK